MSGTEPVPDPDTAGPEGRCWRSECRTACYYPEACSVAPRPSPPEASPDTGREALAELGDLANALAADGKPETAMRLNVVIGTLAAALSRSPGPDTGREALAAAAKAVYRERRFAGDDQPSAWLAVVDRLAALSRSPERATAGEGPDCTCTRALLLGRHEDTCPRAALPAPAADDAPRPWVSSVPPNVAAEWDNPDDAVYDVPRPADDEHRDAPTCPRPESGLCGAVDPTTHVPCWLPEGHEPGHGWEQDQ